jgi:hypothetical protein
MAARRTSKKMEQSHRRKRAAEVVLAGKSVRQAETILREEGFRHADHTTIARDLQHERRRLAEATQATVEEHRATQYAKLLALERFVAEEAAMDDPDMVLALLGIHDRIAKLCGLNLERTAVNVALNVEADPEKMGLYRRFLHEARFVPEAKFEEVWALCRSLAEPPTAETTARIVPPKDSPLWREEVPQLTAGDEGSSDGDSSPIPAAPSHDLPSGDAEVPPK